MRVTEKGSTTEPPVIRTKHHITLQEEQGKPTPHAADGMHKTIKTKDTAAAAGDAKAATIQSEVPQTHTHVKPPKQGQPARGTPKHTSVLNIHHPRTAYIPHREGAKAGRRQCLSFSVARQLSTS